MNLTPSWKLVASLTLLLTLSLWGNLRQLHSSHASPAPAPSTPAASSSAAVTAAPTSSDAEHERVVTELKCPDGATIRQTTTAAARSAAAAPASTSASAAAPAVHDLPRYSVGAEVDPTSPRQDAEIRFGARLGNLPVRATVGAGLRDGKPAATVGLDMDIGG